MSEVPEVSIEQIQRNIINLRGFEVMLDSDLASLYKVSTKVLYQAVRRNQERFPTEFMFKLNDEEFKNLRSQIVTSSEHGGRRYLPNAFTEQGVAMLSTVLKSDTAIKMSIQIINAFVVMRRFISSNASLFNRIEYLERKQIESDTKIEKILDALECRSLTKTQGVFFEGQIFDAFVLLSNIIKSAKSTIRIIDNYIDESILTILLKREKTVNVYIYSKTCTKLMKMEIEKHNRQYPEVKIKKLTKSHDRFIIIDDKVVYHIGASLKDLGKKWFAFSKLDNDGDLIINRIKMIDAVIKKMSCESVVEKKGYEPQKAQK
ncbi:MAG: ORF6N domain-containing protein [Candidatus Stygibacter frigidus]|nr:ORF6N domain-containing protein [Candidatus Stygibacter frigidus]